jgi:hypothetical protein
LLERPSCGNSSSWRGLGKIDIFILHYSNLFRRWVYL